MTDRTSRMGYEGHVSVWKEIWEEEDFWGGRESFEEDETGWLARESSAYAGGGGGEPPSHVYVFPSLQLAGLFSCAVVLAVLLWLGPFFYYLPQVGRRRGAHWVEWNWLGSRTFVPAKACLLCLKAVLACINISSMRQMFFQMRELPQLWHISRVDFVRNGASSGCHPPSTPWFCHEPKRITLNYLICAISNIQA